MRTRDLGAYPASCSRWSLGQPPSSIEIVPNRGLPRSRLTCHNEPSEPFPTAPNDEA